MRHDWARVTVYLCDDGRNLEREKSVMLMKNERLVYVAKPKYPGLPIHGKAGNINNVLKFVIFAKKAGAAPSAHPHRAHRARCPRRCGWRRTSGSPSTNSLWSRCCRSSSATLRT